eukprot:COSAG02_NODE_4034_length_5881_cov_1.969734_3_plen_36_part_00
MPLLVRFSLLLVNVTLVDMVKMNREVVLLWADTPC